MVCFAQKRRYSSIAVEFPIRFDQKPYVQRVFKDFPSWVRAHVRATYVRDLPLDRFYAMSPLYYTHRLHTNSLTIYVHTSRQHHDLSSRRTRLPIDIPVQTNRESFGIRLGITCRLTTQMKCSFSVRSRYVSSSTMVRTELLTS